tara:strand:+ start:71 stop:238 length:168 start_codon:yes stop_codon:yes gene_type:complete
LSFAREFVWVMACRVGVPTRFNNINNLYEQIQNEEKPDEKRTKKKEGIHIIRGLN